MEKKFKRYTVSSYIDLNDYDYHEPYNQEKEYNYEEYKIDYGNGELTYLLGIVHDIKSDVKYVCAFNILNEDEKKELLKYCRCYRHSFEKFSDYFNLDKWIAPAETWGCISSEIQPDQSVIKKSRAYMKYKKNDK